MARESESMCCWKQTGKGRLRLWCKHCRDLGKPWLLGETCQHIQEAIPGVKLDEGKALATLFQLMENDGR